MEQQKAYYAIIPASVRYDKDLTANAKLLYGEITALANQKGYCYATNNYFATLYGVSKSSISKWISQLTEKKYIKSVITYRNQKEINERRIYINDIPYVDVCEKITIPCDKKSQVGIVKNYKDNNTKNNTNDIYLSQATEIQDFLNIDIDFDISFNNLKNKYPNSTVGLTNSKRILKNILTKGIISDDTIYHINHVHIFYAINAYINYCEKNNITYYQNIDKFLSLTLIDFLNDECLSNYEDTMREKYADNWNKIKFIYLF